MADAKVITLINSETGLKVTYVPESDVFKMGKSGLLNQRFKAYCENGTEWSTVAVKMSGILTPVGHMIPEIRLAHRKVYKGGGA